MDLARPYSAVLTGIRALARDTNLYVFDLDSPMQFEAGQFVNIGIPGAHPRGERSYSVWSAPVPSGSSRLEFAIKLFPGGQASEYFRTVALGTLFELKGPYGHFALRDDEQESPTTAHWFLATSTGLAPFHAMLGVAARVRDPRAFRLLFGCRDEGDLFAVEALDALRGQLDFDYEVCLSQPSGAGAYRTGRITAHIPTPDPACRYYLCGNGAMIQEAKERLKAGGVDRKRIHYEKYW